MSMNSTATPKATSYTQSLTPDVSTSDVALNNLPQPSAAMSDYPRIPPAPGSNSTSLISSRCPGDNDTVYSASTWGDQYQIQCYRQFSDSRNIFSISVSAVEDCMDQCSLFNQGLAAVTCYGITWSDGRICSLKPQSSLVTHQSYQDAISGVLLTGVADVVGAF